MTFDVKKTLKFEKAVLMDSNLKLFKKLLADPECDVAYENGKILSLAIRYRSEKIICLLAENSRLKNALESKEACEETVQRKRWNIFRFILERQSNCNKFIKIAYPLLKRQMLYTYFDRNFVLTFVLKPISSRHKRKQSYELIDEESAKICIGFASLNLPCLLLTSLVEHVCSPWSNTVNEYDLWTICSTILHANVLLKEPTKDKIVATKKRLHQLEEEYQFLQDWNLKLHPVSKNDNL